MDRPTRRALLQSSLGAGAGYLAGEYGLDDDNDLVRSILSLGDLPPKPLPPAFSPTYQWERSLSGPQSAVVAFATDYVVLHTGDDIVPIDITDGATAGEYSAPDVHRVTVVDDDRILSIGRSQITGFDVGSGMEFRVPIEAEVSERSVVFEDGVLLLETDAGIRAFDWPTGGERWRTQSRQDLYHVGRVLITSTPGSVVVRRADGTELLSLRVDSDSPIGLSYENQIFGGAVNGAFAPDGGGLLAGTVPTAVVSPDGDVQRAATFDASPRVQLTGDETRGIVIGEVDGEEMALVADLSEPAVAGRYSAARGSEFGETVLVTASADGVVAITLETGDVAWRREDVRPRAVVGCVDGGVVLSVASAARPQRYVVLSESDGSVRSRFESSLVVSEGGHENRPYGPTFVGSDGVIAVNDTQGDVELAFSVPFTDPTVEACTDRVLLIDGEQARGLYDARTGAEIATFGPTSTVSVPEPETDHPSVVAAGATDDGEVFWVTLDGAVSTREIGDAPVERVAVYRDSVLVATARSSSTEADDPPVDIKLLSPAGELLYAASGVDLRDPTDDGDVYVVSGAGERILLRPDGTTASPAGSGAVTVHEAGDDSLVVERGRHLVGYSRTRLRQRWRITDGRLLGIASDEPLVYVAGDGVTCVHAATGLSVYGIDSVRDIYRYDGYNRFSDDSEERYSPIVISEGTIARLDGFEAMARGGIESLRRGDANALSSVRAFREAATVALHDDEELRALQLASAGVGRRTLDAPPEFDGVSGTVRRSVARLLGYDQSLARVDTAARNEEFVSAGRQLSAAEALLRRADSVVAGLGATLGAGIVFAAALARERRLEPDRIETDARERIRVAGAACADAHARGAAVDDLHAAWEAFDDGRYGEAVEAADTAIDHAIREANILQNLANHVDRSAGTLRQLTMEPYYHQLGTRLGERIDAEHGDDAPQDFSRRVAETLADQGSDRAELVDEGEPLPDPSSDPEGDGAEADERDDRETELADRVVARLRDGAYAEAETLLREAHDGAGD